MKRSINYPLLAVCFFSNLYSRRLIVVPLLLVVILSVNAAHANDKGKTDSYKENSKLTSLLEKEQFQMGISCDDAMKLYTLDNKTIQGQHRARIESSRVGFHEGMTVEPGFFIGGCLNNQLDYVEKIISLDANKPEQKVVFDNFIKQYGKPSFQKMNLPDIRYYLLYKGMYTEFSVSLRQVNDTIITIYELEDLTGMVTK